MRSGGRNGTEGDKNSILGWSGRHAGERAPQSSPWSLTAGKENIAPQPQTPHHVVPLALTPPGKVRKACASPTGTRSPWALRE